MMRIGYLIKIFFSLFLLQNSLISQDTLKIFKEAARDFAVDNEGNILAFFSGSKVLQKYLSQYDSVISFSGYDALPLSGECKIALNTRQEIYLLDVSNSRLLVLSKDLRPLTAFYFEQGDLQGLPWDCEISQIGVSVRGFLYLGDTIAKKIYVFDNFWKKTDELEIKSRCNKLLVLEGGEPVCISDFGLHFIFREGFSFEKHLLDAGVYNETLFLLFSDGIYAYKAGEKEKIHSLWGEGFSRLFVAGKVFLLSKNGRFLVSF